MRSFLFGLVATGLQMAKAIDLNADSTEAIRQTLSQVAQGIFVNYTNALPVGSNSSEVGLFPFPPYYWWESGAVWGGIIDYTAYTGDQTYLNMTLNALAAQMGPNYDYIPPEQVNNEANDDQAFWTFAVLAALEQGLPALPCPSGQTPPNCSTSYLTLASQVFDEMTQRWKNDSDSCNGGLRWQYTESNNGWDYKNSPSNLGFFNIAARLARYTGEPVYAQWANKIWEWMTNVGLITENYYIYDGASVESNCTDITEDLWTYNTGMAIYGAAMMYNYTQGSPRWRARVQGLLSASEALFFSPYKNSTDVMYERICEEQDTCNTDQLSFKAYLSRFLGKTAQLAPFVRIGIHTLMKSTAKAAANSCIASPNGTICGSQWFTGSYNGQSGLGQQLCALEAIQSLLARQSNAPATMGS